MIHNRFDEAAKQIIDLAVKGGIAIDDPAIEVFLAAYAILLREIERQGKSDESKT